jgi:hypothetical protein
VLVGDDLPELGTDLVTALATLDGNDLAHVSLSWYPCVYEQANTRNASKQASKSADQAPPHSKNLEGKF